MASPIQTFKDNIRPANLMLQVYSLLDADDDHLTYEGDTVNALRVVIQASQEEELLLIYNEIFLGLVRERAAIPRSILRRGSLTHLLRQAVVASCTGLDSFLPSLLRTNLPLVIQASGRDFVPRDEKEIKEYFRNLTFSIDEMLRLLDDPNPEQYISNKILGLTDFSYLSSQKGIHITGRLLGINQPWENIAHQLGRDQEDLKSVLDGTVKRRNDIIHRADYKQNDVGGGQQEITFAWAKQSVDTIEHICLSLDAIVTNRMIELQAVINGRQQ
jgi:hypothetical protein